MPDAPERAVDIFPAELPTIERLPSALWSTDKSNVFVLLLDFIAARDFHLSCHVGGPTGRAAGGGRRPVYLALRIDLTLGENFDWQKPPPSAEPITSIHTHSTTTDHCTIKCNMGLSKCRSSSSSFLSPFIGFPPPSTASDFRSFALANPHKAPIPDPCPF